MKRRVIAMKRGFILIFAGVVLMTGCQEEQKSMSQETQVQQEAKEVPSEPKSVQSEEQIVEEKEEQVSSYIENENTEIHQKIEPKKEAPRATSKEQPAVSFKSSIEIKPKVKKEEQPKKETIVEKEGKKPSGEVSNKGKKETISYKDQKYPFTLALPATWSNVKIDHNHFDKDVKETINFTMNIAGVDCKIASIFVFDDEVEASSHIEFGSLSKLGEKDGLIYAYIRSKEAPSKLYEPAYEKELKAVQRMIIEEVPVAMSSFTLLQ
jgi:hypothetical protein